jgi:hypothetical protein
MATEFKLVVSDAFQFGQAVALRGGYAIVGARRMTGAESEVGLAYIFVKNGTGWVKQAQVSGSIAAGPNDQFGTAVAIDGDYAIVGARSGGGNEPGRAYVFHRDGSNWVEESVLVASDPADSAFFGQSVALSGDWAMVGSGDAYMFRRTGSTWTVEDRLTGITGRAVSLSGNYAVARDSSGIALKVFQRYGTNWQQQAVLTASDASNYIFGDSVSISGDYIIAGAPNGDANSAGAAYVFVNSGSVWIQQAKLEPNTGIQRTFGTSVGISGNYALVGDPFDAEVADDSGAAYIFQRKGVAWLLIEKIVASDAAARDDFGMSVAIDASAVGGLAIVGAPDKALGDVEGEAYILSDFSAAIGGVIDPRRLIAIVGRILFGIIGDGGGVIWVPGIGPVPVPPSGPLNAYSGLSPAKRDVLVGLALSEMANLINNADVQQEVRTTGLKLVKQAANRLQVPSETDAP